ncbi:MAG: GNAT family protein [Cyanobacteria bacterium J06554_11]
MKIEPRNIELRPTRLADLSFVMSAERHAENAAYIDQWRQAQHETAIVSEDEAHFIVEQAGKAVGYVVLDGMDSPHKSLLLRRIVILPKGAGYGRQTLRWLKVQTFERMRYHRLWLDVVVSNERALMLYLSEGFVVEGTLREAFKAADGYKDMLVLAMIKTDYFGEGDS